MELLPTGIHIYTCEDYDRHKIWVDHPHAKEISRKQYESARNISDEIKKTENYNK